jgi:hypothetical protein
MKIAFAGFKGELPILDPTLLPASNAQKSRNAYLKKGTLKSEKGPALMTGISGVVDPSSLFFYPSGNNGQGYWFVWGNDLKVDAVKSMLADDAWKRVYWTGDGPPKMGSIAEITSGSGPYPSSNFRLGIPAPTDAPIVTRPADRVDDSEKVLTAVQTSYVVTCISKFGEEGPPSMPSASIMRWDMVDGAAAGGNVEISLPSIPSGNHPIISKRIYRAESAGVFQYVADVPAAQGTFTDSIPSESLSATLPSTEWDMPDDKLIGLTEMPGGFLAGYFGNTLCFSEAYYPHAWPVSYQLAFSDEIVGISAVSGGLVVATKGRPHLVTGSTPAAMADQLIDSDQPCLAGRSVVDMGSAAIYASPQGLVAVGGGEAQLLTEQVISEEQWMALNPKSIHAYRYENRYLAFYDGGAFSFTAADGFEFYDIHADDGYYDILNNTLCLIQDDKITGWRKGADLKFLWRSKVHEVPGQSGFTCGKIIAKQYPITLRLIADGVTAMSADIPGPQLFRLPAGYSGSRNWEVEVEGFGEIVSIQIASSPSEII